MSCSSVYWCAHIVYFMLIVRTIFPCVWPWDFRKHLVCERVCVLTVLLVTERLDCWVVFLQTSQIYVLSSWETYRHGGERDGEAGRMAELPIIWCCLSCIILSSGGKVLKKPQSRTIEDRERKRRDCPLRRRINVKSWQGKPSLLYPVCVF